MFETSTFIATKDTTCCLTFHFSLFFQVCCSSFFIPFLYVCWQSHVRWQIHVGVRDDELRWAWCTTHCTTYSSLPSWAPPSTTLWVSTELIFLSVWVCLYVCLSPLSSTLSWHFLFLCLLLFFHFTEFVETERLQISVEWNKKVYHTLVISSAKRPSSSFLRFSHIQVWSYASKLHQNNNKL